MAGVGSADQVGESRRLCQARRRTVGVGHVGVEGGEPLGRGVLGPQPVRAAEVRDARVGGDAGPGQHHHPPRRPVADQRRAAAPVGPVGGGRPRGPRPRRPAWHRRSRPGADTAGSWVRLGDAASPPSTRPPGRSSKTFDDHSPGRGGGARSPGPPPPSPTTGGPPSPDRARLHDHAPPSCSRGSCPRWPASSPPRWARPSASAKRRGGQVRPGHALVRRARRAPAGRRADRDGGRAQRRALPAARAGAGRHAVELPALAGGPLRRPGAHGRQRRPAQARLQRARRPRSSWRTSSGGPASPRAPSPPSWSASGEVARRHRRRAGGGRHPDRQRAGRAGRGRRGRRRS